MSESTILIVDDEAAIREMVGITLDLAGFSSISASDAREAHISVIDNKPDLVLLDWMLPGGSGIELARRLRRDEITSCHRHLNDFSINPITVEHPPYMLNGSFTRIVSSRSGLVESSATGIRVSSSTRRIYFRALAGKSAHVRTP